jgi:hypothetical protein
VSEAQKTNSQSSSATANRGSLQVLNLGPLLVGQLAQAINWSNDAAFKRPECKPWVDLPPDANIASTLVSTPEAVVADISAVSVVSEESKTVSSLTSVDTIKEVSASDESTAQVVTRDEESPAPPLEPATERPSEHAELESQDGKLQPDVVEISQKGSSAVLTRSDDVSLQVTPTPTVSEEQIIAMEEGGDAQPAAMVDQATESRPELDHSQSKTELKPNLASGLSHKPEDIQSDKPTIVPNTDRPVPSAVETVTSSKVRNIGEDTSRAEIEIANREETNAARVTPQKSRDSDRIGKQKPHLSPTVPMAERASFAKSASMHPKADQLQDDYLLQLERLVVELNMELAQVRGEQTGADPMEQMANRIIALNLENLALREKLQQSNP